MAKRKQSEAQLANLEKGKGFYNTETARRANAASQEAKKRYKPFKDVARDVVSPEDFAKIAETMKAMAIEGDPRAFDLLLQYMGERPAEKVEAAAAVTIMFDDSVDQSWLV